MTPILLRKGELTRLKEIAVVPSLQSQHPMMFRSKTPSSQENLWLWVKIISSSMEMFRLALDDVSATLGPK
jgi:hypothetical protein